MKRKLRILSNISIIALSVCMFAFGVYAATNASFTTSGTVSFTATDVYAKVTRTIENIDSSSTYNAIDIIYTAGTPNNHEDKFKNENLVFESADKDIVMTFTIQNLATETGRYVYVTFTETESESNNVTKLATALGGEIAIAPGESKEIVVYMYVTNPNLSASAGYDYTLALNNKSAGVVLDDTLATFTASSDGTYYTLSGLKTASTAEVSSMSTSVAMADTIDPATLTNIIIPSEIDGMPVTQIGASAFQSNTTLTNITIPDSVTTIGSDAFNGCKNLIVCNIDESSNLELLGNRAFATCAKLTNIHLPIKLTSIGSQCFQQAGLINIDLQGVKDIPTGSFYVCNQLRTVSFSKDLKTIGYCAFGGSPKLRTVITNGAQYTFTSTWAFGQCYMLKSIDLPDSLTSIPDSTFSKCYELEINKLPDNIETIGKQAFSSCTRLKTITLSTSLKSIGQQAFQYTGLTSIILPSGLTNIGIGAFAYCTNLQTVILPDTLESIANQAFRNCTSLTSITLPASLISIEGLVFTECSSLTSLILSERTEEFIIPESCFMGVPISGEFYLPNNYILETNGESDCTNGPFLRTNITSFRVSETNTRYMTVNGILYRRKSYDSNNANYNVPLVLESYPSAKSGDYTIPATVNQLRRYELSDAEYLTNVYVESGNGTFSSIDGNLYLTGQSTLYLIPQGRNEKIINVPTGITKIYNGAVPSNAEEIYLPTEIISIGGAGFGNNESLVKVGSLGQEVEEGTFDFTQLTKLTILDYKCFEYCFGMKILKVGENFTTFGDACFAYAYNLEEIYIYNSTSVVSYLYDPEGYSETAEDNFEDLTKLSAIYVPDDLVDEYQASEYWSPVASKIKPLSEASAT